MDDLDLPTHTTITTESRVNFPEVVFIVNNHGIFSIINLKLVKIHINVEDPGNEDSEVSSTEKPRVYQEKDYYINNTNIINTASDGNTTNNVNVVSSTVNAAVTEVNDVDLSTYISINFHNDNTNVTDYILKYTYYIACHYLHSSDSNYQNVQQDDSSLIM
ncbi:hypothetical protein Tco_0638167 [Tanacetum coccineum]